jgi:hypothetical protein
LKQLLLCLPPTAGERERGTIKTNSLLEVFLRKGYSVNYLYGGEISFLITWNFFGGNGYKIIDKNIATR